MVPVTLVQAVERLNHAKCLFKAVELAFGSVEDFEEREALQTAIGDAIDVLLDCIEGVHSMHLKQTEETQS